jgi:hypothetical protein
MVSMKTVFTGLKYPDLYETAFGVALSCHCQQKAYPARTCDTIVEAENAISELQAGALAFSIPFKESVVVGTGSYNEDLRRLEYERACLIDFMQTFVKDKQIPACVLEGHPDLNKALLLAREDKIGWGDMYTKLEFRRAHTPVVDLSLDAAVALRLHMMRLFKLRRKQQEKMRKKEEKMKKQQQEEEDP